MSALFGVDFLSVELFRLMPNLPWNILNVIISIMPTIGYLDQLKKMIETEDSSSFNMTTALILLFSNTLRFIYWTFEPFQAYLLGQSIAVFLVQLILSLKSFEYNEVPRSFTSSLKSMKLKIPSLSDFQKWLKITKAKTSLDFILSLITYAIIMIAAFAVMSMIIGLKASLQIIIFASNIIDTTVSFPMFKRIVIDHNVHNLSVVLIGQYLLGDLLKIIMFTVGGSGFAFMFGAILQTTIDGTDAIFFALLSKKNKGKEEDRVPLMEGSPANVL